MALVSMESLMKSLFLLLTLSVFSTNVALADDNGDGERCIGRWSFMIGKFNESVENMNNGFNIIGNNPQSAFDYLNGANSTLSAFDHWPMDIYLDCKDYTNITEELAQEIRSEFLRLEERTSCGLVLASAIKTYHGVDAALDEYNNAVTNYPDQVDSLGYKTLVAVRSNQQKFRTMMKYTPSCNPNADLIDFAGQYADSLKDYEDFFKRFE